MSNSAVFDKTSAAFERVIDREEAELRPLTDTELDAVAGGYKWDEGCRRSAIRDGSATVVLPPLQP